MDEVPFKPDIAAIVDGLGSSPLYVDPSLAGEFTADQIAAISASIESSPTPIHVIAVPLSRKSDLSPVQLITLVHRQLPEDGIWYVTLKSYNDRWDIESTTYGVKVDNANNLANYVARDLYPTDLGLQLAKTTELIAKGTARKEYDQLNRESTQPPPTQPDDSSSGVSLPVVGVGLGVLAVLVAAVLLGRRRSVARGEVAVKGRALRRISTAQTDAWRHRAEVETARLGTRINALQIDADADKDAWTAALDHYETANRVLDRTRSAADSIGALVLAERGHDALEHAIKGTTWQPRPSCFFNPLHGEATTKVTWRTAAGSRDVPSCQSCRRLVSKRKEPDFLDLPVGDTVVHYVDADESAEPWASTGYGSLDPDLLPKL